jgi:hypothetical protein
MSAGRAQHAIAHRHEFRGQPLAHGAAGLQADRIVDRLDEAIRNPDVPRTIGVDAIGPAVADIDPIDDHILATEETDGVVRRIADGDAADVHPFAP